MITLVKSLRGSLCLLWLTISYCSQVLAAPPNIVLILADDLGYETLGCYGGTSYATPNINRLAAGGLRFDRAYAMPLCTNTRIQLMTGKYNLRNWTAFGILDPAETTFAHVLKNAGYKTCMAGKWQLTSYDPPDYPGADLRRNTGMRVADAGFDEYSLWHVGHTEDKGSRYADPVIEQNGQLLEGTQGKYGPDLWTDFIGDFMTRHRQQPFFVYYSMALPHNPMNPTPDSPEWQDPQRRHDDVTRFAADMIRYTDKMVGKLVDRLDALGLRENTLILFCSDNGTNARVASEFRGQLVRGEKGKGTELGCRVPMIANWQGRLAANQTSQALIDSVDFLPTFIDVAGVPPDAATQAYRESLDGISFWPVLNGESSSARQHVYIHQDPRPGWDKDRFQLIRVAINPRYKLYEDGRMFDVVDDFLERRPLWVQEDNPEQRQARIELQQVLDSFYPFRIFDPSQVPRPDPSNTLQQHAFQDHGGLLVVEAEQIPIPRDESWVVENELPGYTGLGYVRALRQQLETPQAGVATLALSVDVAGGWSVAVRCRSDHVSGQAENRFWIRQESQSWISAEIPDAAVGQWAWVSIGQPNQFRLEERRNEFQLAPLSRNIKIDRVVFYQSDRQPSEALSLDARPSAFHPWASP